MGLAGSLSCRTAGETQLLGALLEEAAQLQAVPAGTEQQAISQVTPGDRQTVQHKRNEGLVPSGRMLCPVCYGLWWII